jgi:hypothetical protein
MTGPAKAALAASLLALAACGGGGTGNESAKAAGAANGDDANAAAPAPAAGNEVNQAAAAPAAAGDGAVTREYLVGRWTEEEMNDCAGAATEFRADGTFLFPWGDTGNWSLAGDQLTMTGNSNALTVRAVDANTIEIRSPSRTYRNKRCT